MQNMRIQQILLLFEKHCQRLIASLSIHFALGSAIAAHHTRECFHACVQTLHVLSHRNDSQQHIATTDCIDHCRYWMRTEYANAKIANDNTT